MNAPIQLPPPTTVFDVTFSSTQNNSISRKFAFYFFYVVQGHVPHGKHLAYELPLLNELAEEWEGKATAASLKLPDNVLSISMRFKTYADISEEDQDQIIAVLGTQGWQFNGVFPQKLIERP